ncbi:MAG: tripartite tricarboxylate transporter TctB family protein [Aquabacterium sp.]
MKIKSQKDFWSGLMFLLVGIGFAWGALNYNFGSSARPGPGYFPFGLGVLQALLGAFIMFEALTIETEDGEPIGAAAWKPLLIVTGAMVLLGFMLPKLGMAISLPVLVLLASLADPEFSWRGSIINATALTVFSWLVFIVGLKLTIPLWPTFVGA